MNLLRAVLIVSSWCLNLLPSRIALALGDLFGLIWFWLIPIRRELVLQNLTACFGNEMNPGEIKKLGSRNYRHYGRCLVEMLRSLRWTQADYRNRVIFEGMEHVAPYLEKKVGGFFLACHMGNWEIMAGSGAAQGIPLDVIIKRPKSASFEKLLPWFRSRLKYGVHIETGTAKDILKAVSQGRFIGFMLDQYMGAPVGIPVRFFGRPAGSTVSLAIFAEKGDVPVLPVYSYRDEKGRLHTVIEKPLDLTTVATEREDRLYELTQKFNDTLEERIRRHPDQWLWLHRRWKPFRGEPKWKSRLAVSTATALLCLVLLGCSSTATTPTGIELPPDANIAVPAKFENVDSEADTSAMGADVKEATPVPVEVKKEEKKKNKKMVKETPPPPPPTTPKRPKDMFEAIAPDKVPFDVGERMEIALGWMALPAGTATVEVRNGAAFNGRPTYHLWANVLSSKLVDTIYHVDNTIESWIDREGFMPYKFLLHMLETHQKKETRVSFDHTQSKAFYWAKRISQKWGDTFDDRTDTLIPQARDMFSALFYARTLNYQLNQKSHFFIYENGQNWEVELTPVANEIVTSAVGAFQCWKILVNVKLNNVLRPTGDIYMWLSDDSRRYLVKFDAKIKIGSLYGNLISLRERQ